MRGHVRHRNLRRLIFWNIFKNKKVPGMWHRRGLSIRRLDCLIQICGPWSGLVYRGQDRTLAEIISMGFMLNTRSLLVDSRESNKGWNVFRSGQTTRPRVSETNIDITRIYSRSQGSSWLRWGQINHPRGLGRLINVAVNLKLQNILNYGNVSNEISSNSFRINTGVMFTCMFV
jgi:hypothetical protein